MDCAETDSEEVILLYFEAFNAKDRAGMLRLLSPELVHEIDGRECGVGREAFSEHLSHRFREKREKVEELVVMIAEGGLRAAAEFVLTASHGNHVHSRTGAFFELRHGRITRVSEYSANLKSLMNSLLIREN